MCLRVCEDGDRQGEPVSAGSRAGDRLGTASALAASRAHEAGGATVACEGAARARDLGHAQHQSCGGHGVGRGAREAHHDGMVPPNFNQLFVC